MLGAIGGEKKQLGHRGDRFFGFEKRFAKTASEGSSAGFLRGNDIDTSRAEITGQHTKLR